MEQINKQKTMEQKIINNLEGQLRGLEDNVEETRKVTFIASTSSVDRHGTVVNQKNWNIEKFNANPIVGYQHNVYGGEEANPDDQLGSARAYFETVKKGAVEEQQLMVDITFEPRDINEKADKIFRKIQHGSLRAVSVGFIPVADDNGSMGENREGAFHYFGQGLLEISVVNIPSNPDALKRSLLDLVKEPKKEVKKVEEVTKTENVKSQRELLLLLKGKK